MSRDHNTNHDLNIKVRLFPDLASNIIASSIEIRPLLALIPSEYLNSKEIIRKVNQNGQINHFITQYYSTSPLSPL